MKIKSSLLHIGLFIFLICINPITIFASAVKESDNEYDYTPTLSSIRFFDTFFDLSSLPELKFSLGVESNLKIDNSKFVFTPIFAFYNSSTTIFFPENDDVYFREYKGADFGGKIAYETDKYSFFLSGEMITKVFLSNADKNFLYKMSLGFSLNYRKNNYYISSGDFLNASVTYFLNSSLCYYFSISHNQDIINLKNKENSLRLVSTSQLNSKGMLFSTPSDYILTRFAFDTLFVSSPGVGNSQRLSFRLLQKFTLLSPYFFKDYMLFYSSAIFETGSGFWNIYSDTKFPDFVWKVSASLEVGIKIKYVGNAYIRISYFYPRFNKIKEQVSFLFTANIS